jgi:hypothetical protein
LKIYVFKIPEFFPIFNSIGEKGYRVPMWKKGDEKVDRDKP